MRIRRDTPHRPNGYVTRSAAHQRVVDVFPRSTPPTFTRAPGDHPGSPTPTRPRRHWLAEDHYDEHTAQVPTVARPVRSVTSAPVFRKGPFVAVNAAFVIGPAAGTPLVTALANAGYRTDDQREHRGTHQRGLHAD